MDSIIVIEPDPIARRNLVSILNRNNDFQVRQADLADARLIKQYDCVLAGLLAHDHVLDVCRSINTPVVAIVPDSAKAKQALNKGAADCLIAGKFDSTTLLKTIQLITACHRRDLAENHLRSICISAKDLTSELSGLTSDIRLARQSMAVPPKHHVV